MTNKLQANIIQKQNLYTYSELNNTSGSNMEYATLSFITFRKVIRVLLNMRKRLKAIEGN
ncbi:MAG: hypothetical protein RSD26_07405 [Cellulosilyticaceae bacterium]